MTFGPESFVNSDVFLPSRGFKGWYTATTQFTATSTSEVLSFLAYGTLSVPPYLRLPGVSLTKNAVPGPVPIIGLAAAYGWSRKLRRQIQASGRQRALAAHN